MGEISSDHSEQSIKGFLLEMRAESPEEFQALRVLVRQIAERKISPRDLIRSIIPFESD